MTSDGDEEAEEDGGGVFEDCFGGVDGSCCCSGGDEEEDGVEEDVDDFFFRPSLMIKSVFSAPDADSGTVTSSAEYSTFSETGEATVEISPSSFAEERGRERGEVGGGGGETAAEVVEITECSASGSLSSFSG